LVTLLIARGADANSKESDGDTPLIWALKADSVDSATLLLQHGADANARDKDGWTPLMFAALYVGTPDVAKLLIDHRADVNAKNRKGESVLAIAANAGRDDMAALLRQHGAQ
jgi:ankyrin repeat protein